MSRTLLGELVRILRRDSAAGQDLTDGALLQRFLDQRDEVAFEALVQRHGPMVLGVCQRVIGDTHAAEDAFQATFLVLARKAGSIRKQASVGSWLFGVAQRIAYKARAQAATRRDRERRAADMPHTETLNELTWQELRSILDEEIGRLPAKYQAAVVLCHLEGKSYDQAARELGCPKSTLATRLAKALELLRGRLTRRGLALSAGALATALTEKASAAPVAALLSINIMKAAASVAAGQTVPTGILSTQAIALAEEAMKTMIGITGKLIVLFGVLGLAVGAGLAGHSAWVAQVPPQPAEKQPPAAKDDAPKKDAPPAVALDRFGDPLPDGALARLGADGVRHPGVRQVIFSTDGKTLFSTGPDRVVRRWDVSSGRLLRTQSYATDKREYGDLSEYESYPHLSPDGKTVAVIGQKHLYFFDAATGKELHCVGGLIGGLPGLRNYAAFTADGKQFGCFRSGGAFLLVDVATGKAINTGLPENLGKQAPGPGPTLATRVQAALDPTGKQLATYTKKDGVTLWDLSSGKVLHTIPTDPDMLYKMLYAPAGNRLLLATHKKDMVLLNTATGKKEAEYSRATAPPGSFWWFCFSADGTRLAVAFDGSIHILNTKTMKEARKLLNSSGHTFQFSADGKTLAGLGSNLIQLWNVADGKPLHNFADQDNVSWVVYSPDGKSLASGGDGTVIWDLETKKPRATIRSPMGSIEPWLGAAESIFSTDSKTLFGPVNFGTIKGWNVADGKEIATTFLTADDEKGRDHQNVRWMGVSRDGKRLMAYCMLLLNPSVTHEGERSFVVWDIASGERRDRTTFSEKNDPIAFSPNGPYFAYPKDQNVVLYDLAQKQERVMGRVTYREARFSHDNTLLAIPSVPDRRGTPSAVSVYETATGNIRINLPQLGGGSGVPFAFTPDDRYLLCAGPDEWLLWEIATGKEVFRRAVEGKGRGIAIAPDGRSAAMVAPDATVLLWDLLPSSRAKGDLAAKDLESLWADLADEDAAKAYQAGGRLIGAPAKAWAFLDKQLRPVADETERIRRLIAALDDNDFQKRQAASKELQQLELLAEPELRKTLDGKPSAETIKTVKALLDDVWTVKTAAERQRMRAVLVLEQIGSADARQTLERLAGGAAAARQTHDAKAALQRLKAKE